MSDDFDRSEIKTDHQNKKNISGSPFGLGVSRMMLQICQLRGYCELVAKKNLTRFDLKETPEFDFSQYGNTDFIINKVLKFMRLLPGDSEIVLAPNNWKYIVDWHCDLKKIKSIILKMKNESNRIQRAK